VVLSAADCVRFEASGVALGRRLKVEIDAQDYVEENHHWTMAMISSPVNGRLVPLEAERLADAQIGAFE
jgi:hypothetical protein